MVLVAGVIMVVVMRKCRLKLPPPVALTQVTEAIAFEMTMQRFKKGKRTAARRTMHSS
jgi:hypothetical protein